MANMSISLNRSNTEPANTTPINSRFNCRSSLSWITRTVSMTSIFSDYKPFLY